jgi:hypothetical protein
MKVSEFRKLIREEVENLMAEAADPLDYAFGKIYRMGERDGTEDRVLDALDTYLESLGLFDLQSKWLEREDTGYQISKPDAVKLLKAFNDFYTENKGIRTKWLSVRPAMLRLMNRTGFRGTSIGFKPKPFIKYMSTKLSEESLKVFNNYWNKDLDHKLYDSKEAIATLIGELEDLAVKLKK